MRIIAVLLLATTVGTAAYLATNNRDNPTYVASSYKNTTQNFQKVSVSSILEEIQNEDENTVIHDSTTGPPIVIPGMGNPTESPPPQQDNASGDPGEIPPTGNTHTIQGPDGLGIIKQWDDEWANIGNPGLGSNTMKRLGCGIFAAYSAYANRGGTSSFEDTLLNAFSDRIEVGSDGKLHNKANTGFEMGYGTGDWVKYVQTLGLQISGRIDGTPSKPGDYLFRYEYTGSAHNIFVRITENSNGELTYQAGCSSQKSWADTIVRPGYTPKYYYKVG